LRKNLGTAEVTEEADVGALGGKPGRRIGKRPVSENSEFQRYGQPAPGFDDRWKAFLAGQAAREHRIGSFHSNAGIKFQEIRLHGNARFIDSRGDELTLRQVT
jgi:hypothetical protein